MQDVVLEFAAELISLVVLSVVGTSVGFLGLLMETIGYDILMTQDPILGYWYLYMGTIALYAAIYLIGIRELRPRAQTLRTKLSS